MVLTFVVMDIVPILEYFSKLTGVLSKRLLEFFDEIVTADVDASLEWQVSRDFVRFKHVAEKILGLFRFFLRLNRWWEVFDGVKIVAICILVKASIHQPSREIEAIVLQFFLSEVI